MNNIVGNGGGPYKTLKGAMNIHDADVHNVPFNQVFHKHAGISSTLTAEAAAGAIDIVLADATSFAIGNTIQIEDGVVETTFPKITNKVGNTLTLDRPLDNLFAIGDTASVISTELATEVGSITAPVSYRVSPDSSIVWHVENISISMVHSGAGDDSKFGDATALTNGVLFRAYNATTGKYRTFTNWKTNRDIGEDAGPVNYTDKAGGGKFATNATANIKERSGAVPRIDGAAGDFIEMLIQDDFAARTSLTSLRFKVQGHLEDV